MLWMRMDGRSVHTDPALYQQGTTDILICQGETQRVAAVAPDRAVSSPRSGGTGIGNSVSDLGVAMGDYQATQTARQAQSVALMDVMRGCMAQRGYTLRPNPQESSPR